MIDALQYEFIRNALMAALLASIACGVIGAYVVTKRITFISGAIAHAAFGGVGLGYFLGINPVLAVIPFSLLSAIGIGAVSRKARLPEDSTIGIFWAVGMAMGVVLISLTPGYAPDLFNYLFGNILMVPASDLVLMLILDAVIAGIVALFYKEFLAISFDEEYARVAGVKTTFFYFLLLCLVALTVVVLIRVVGVVLVIALLTIPSAITRLFGAVSLRRMMAISASLGAALTVSGLCVSYWLNLPSGATIILVSAVAFILALAVSRVSALTRRN